MRLAPLVVAGSTPSVDHATAASTVTVAAPIESR